MNAHDGEAGFAPLGWMDVTSTRLDVSLDFYRQLFPWQREILNDAHSPGYSFLRSEGHVVAGAEPIPEEKGPPVWTVMVVADDADATVGQAVSRGGVVTYPVGPILDLGRIAMVRDPQGAIIGVWEPGTYRPLDVPAVPGRLVGAEIVTPDAAATCAFYEEVFGWRRADASNQMDAGVPVRVVEREGPALWTPVLHIPAAADLAGRLLRAGGQVIVGSEPVDARDPMGARLLLQEA